MNQWQQLQNGSDIRGVAIDGVANEPVNLTPEVVNILGQAFTQWLAQTSQKVVADVVIAIGQDSRLSGDALVAGAVAGITSMGAKVYGFGLASTPAMFMSTITAGFNCDGAVMLTASHLPFNRNGLKFFTPSGGLEKQNITEILELAAGGQFQPQGVIAEFYTACDFMAVYAQQLVNKIRQGVNHPQNYDQPLKGLKILVDAGNGAGGFYAHQVLKPLGADTSGSQFLEPDGHFPNHIPNPEDPEAIASICEAVVKHGADFGIIFDTDVDRSGAVDHNGKELNRNRLIALMSAIVLAEHPHSTIVTDSITSNGLAKFITADLQGIHHRFKRGYKNVINEAMRLNGLEQESWLAIETSGHGALRENYFLDDGAYLVSKLLVELAKAKLAGRNLTELIANLEEPLESQEYRIKITASDFHTLGNQAIAQITEFAKTQPDWQLADNNYEGVRVNCDRGWFLLRLSLHDPVMPLNIESNQVGGVSQIYGRLISCLTGIEGLSLPSTST